MVEESGGDEAAEPVVEVSSSAATTLALGAFMHDGRASEEARDYLQRQSRLAEKQAHFLDLQMESLHEQRQLHVSHLKWRQFNDRLRGASAVMIAIVGAFLFIGLCAWLWSAAHDNGLVIETFSVPPDLAARGLTGQAVASRLLDDLSAMQAETDTVRAANSYSDNWGDDIKVQIPETGVSVGELNRYLRAWLGHETHITGEVFATQAGLAVTARAGSDAAPTFEGPERNLDALLQKAAEQIYARTQPYRYAMYLGEHGKVDESIAVLARLASTTSGAERAWAYVGWSIALNGQGRIVESGERARDAIAANPENFSAWGDLLNAELTLDHPEGALAAGQKGLVLLRKGGDADIAPRSAILAAETEASIDEFLGDFRNAAKLDRSGAQLPNIRHQGEFLAAQQAQDWALDHDGAAAREALARAPRFDDPYDAANFKSAVGLVDIGLENWRRALVSNKDAVATWRLQNGPDDGSVRVFIVRGPTAWLAYAEAMNGDIAGARKLIAITPGDCYTCLRLRGKIDTVAKNWGAAAYWFASATRAAPSIPFAYTDWGQMLMATRNYDGAIAMFKVAAEKGPHFADPLELWGEALIAQNRSDLALAKFADAQNYAPHWGRLYLEWGESLDYVGRHDEAQSKYAAASVCDINPADRARLTDLMTRRLVPAPIRQR